MELGTGRRNVWLALYFPSSVWRHEFVGFLTSLLAAHTRASMRKVIRPEMFLKILRWLERWTGFQHHDAQSTFGQHFGSSTSGCARPDDANVITLR
jgi:hypothetical protein